MLQIQQESVEAASNSRHATEPAAYTASSLDHTVCCACVLKKALLRHGP